MTWTSQADELVILATDMAAVFINRDETVVSKRKEGDRIIDSESGNWLRSSF